MKYAQRLLRSVVSHFVFHHFFFRESSPPEDRPEILNIISLEFTTSALAEIVRPPTIAQTLDMVLNSWPRERLAERPRVQRYCLTGVANAYTDFHVDFGGTSVWYHIVKGCKVKSRVGSWGGGWMAGVFSSHGRLFPLDILLYRADGRKPQNLPRVEYVAETAVGALVALFLAGLALIASPTLLCFFVRVARSSLEIKWIAAICAE